MLFGDILRNLLDERKLTQKQLSIELNIATSTLGNYIRNLREPDYETLKQIAAYFDVTTDYLLDFNHSDTGTRLDNELLRIFHLLSNEQQELYIEQGRVFVIQNNKKAKSSRSGGVMKTDKIV